MENTLDYIWIINGKINGKMEKLWKIIGKIFEMDLRYLTRMEPPISEQHLS